MSGSRLAAAGVERAYGFRDRLAGPHTSDRRDPTATPRAGEVIIDSTWRVAVPRGSEPLVLDTARDLLDHLRVSMELDLELELVDRGTDAGARTLMITTGDQAAAPRSYTIDVSPDRIVLTGADDRGAARGSHFLESLLNLRGGPFLEARSWSRAPVFDTRMTHSGWGLDEFPDGHLSQIAHAGFTAVVVFATAPDHTPDATTHRFPGGHSPGRHQDFDAIVDRCERHGLDVYLYAYFHGEDPVHPDDPDAPAFFDRTYGALFAQCPRAKGIVLVGESVEFRSRDPRTNGRLRLDPVAGAEPSDLPFPGWWPCTDFPAWVAGVRDACRRQRPDAEIIFWTYNWGWAPQEDRLALINSLPADVTVQATFEMFEPISHDGVTNACVDYTASSVGPGRYFSSEAAAARARGLRLHAMANTGGLTWDFGVIGYQPIPFQWAERHAALIRANADWGLSGLMENHHYGWYPSFVSELATSSYWSGGPSAEEMIIAIARRDFGAGAELAVDAWRRWSSAAADYVPTNADQYGPFRIGPSYPITLFARPRLAVADDVMFGDLIVTTPYAPDTTGSVPTTAVAIRTVGELASLGRMLTTWREGVELLARAAEHAPGPRRRVVAEQVNLGEFIARCIQTTIHVKQWWQVSSRLMITVDADEADTLLDRLVEIGEAEHTNAAGAIGLVEADSRLGWEPSMGYLGDADHLRWKLAHLRHAIDHEIPAFRTSLRS